MHAADGSEEAAARETENPAKEGSSGDHWPADPKEQDVLIVELDRLGREQLRGQEPDALRRARIVDKQTEVLLRRKRQGDLPEHPRAWFRKLVDHGFRSSKIPYGRNHVPLDLEWMQLLREGHLVLTVLTDR